LGLTQIKPPQSPTKFLVISEKSYDLCVIRMQAYIKGLDLLKVVEEDYIVAPLPKNLTMSQIKMQKEK